MPTVRHTRRPPPRGFTLVEVGIAAAIVGVISAMGYAALDSLNKKTAFANRTREVTSLLQGMQLEALQRGYPVVLLIDPERQRHAMFVDRGPMVNPGSYNPATPDWVTENEARSNPTANAAKDIVLSLVEWDPRFGLSGSGLATGFKFPAPYQLLPADRPCSFCVSAMGGAGLLIANPNGLWSFSGTYQEAATLVFEKYKSGEPRRYAVGVVARGGLLYGSEVL